MVGDRWLTPEPLTVTVVHVSDVVTLEYRPRRRQRYAGIFECFAEDAIACPMAVGELLPFVLVVFVLLHHTFQRCS